ncbi:hypothetical protein GCM10027341_09860 [Spirosoma knui]
MLGLISLNAYAQTDYIANTTNTTTSGQRTLIGVGAGSNGTGGGDVMVGFQTGPNTTGSNSTFVGYRAGYTNTTANNNTFIGSSSGYSNSIGENNVFLGAQSGYDNNIGVRNVFLGVEAGARNTTASENTFVGYRAGFSNTTGVRNAIVGFEAGFNNQDGTANVFTGYRSGYKNTSGTSNIFIGELAGYTNSTGSINTFIGAQAGSNNATGSYNMFMGNSTGNSNISGSFNMALGNGAGYHNKSNRNVYIGSQAGFNNESGSNNIFIGPDVAPTIVSGNSNVFIGYQANAGGADAASLTNAVAIGANALVSASNSVVLGNNANVGIGTSAPQAKLEVTQGTANQSGLRLTNLTSNSPATELNRTKFLTVNASGDVVLGSLNGSTRAGANESLWERNGATLQSTQGESVVIGSGVSQTPSGYKLYVEQGILTERVKVAVKNTSEWSDYVFKPGYALRPLAEVERYINQHQHLPGVLSAKEMVEQGNDLHQTDAKLLEKIEELTLYSIQLEKIDHRHQESLEKQQAEIDDLKRVVKQLLNKK